MKSIRNDEVLLAELNKTAADRSSAVEKAQRIRDAEAAVIAAADKAEAADAAIDAGGSYTEAADADKALYAAVRAWREARK